nr:multicopper oxidase family protein [Effusibacillus dendaii]
MTTPGLQNVSTKPPFDVLTGNKFTLTAKPAKLQIDGQTTKDVWTFNGTVPGPQIRVKQGEQIQVVLKNELSVPVTIHWHGVPVPNSQDGIPGVTMNAVQPGQSFTYQFKADVPGTYWYHSHQDSLNQVDMGLYGSFIVEPKNEPKVDRDYTVVLDEWMPGNGMPGMSHGGMNMGTSQSGSNDSKGSTNMGGMNMDHSNMNMGGNSQSGMNMNSGGSTAKGGHGGMNMGGMDMSGMSDSEMMPLMYTIYTANGKSGSAIQPLQVKKGDKVRIRLINAGYISHPLHLQGHDFKIVSTDGQPVNNPPLVGGQLLNIAPGERYDIEFTADNPGNWLLEEHSKNPGAKGLAIPIMYEGVSGQQAKPDNTEIPVLDITKYGEASKGQFSLNDKFDVEYNMELNTATGPNGMKFTINGKTFPDAPPVNVKEGDLVKVTLVNKSPKDIHPMHLHGHFFQVLSKNGQPVTGAPLMKDTLNVLPGEEYVIAFKADNPGDWMFHCHDLGHAANGMVTEVKYSGYKPNFTVDPNAGNIPE